jgi:putative FmdB family regulatory protein
MPLYDYACRSCGKTTEILQRFDDPPVQICPHCGGELKKLLSAPAFQFKGSGWYVTDYARKSGGGGKSAGSSADSGAGESKSEPKGESKSEAKGSESSASSSSSGSKPAAD